jgi:hypothetical protein
MSIKAINFAQSCVKTLSAVEAEASRSNQHEFNGVTQLKYIFGCHKIQKKAYFSVRGNDKLYCSSLTWYDAREAHPIRSEYRLYFKSNPVMSEAKEGDNVVIGYDINGALLILYSFALILESKNK